MAEVAIQKNPFPDLPRLSAALRPSPTGDVPRIEILLRTSAAELLRVNVGGDRQCDSGGGGEDRENSGERVHVHFPSYERTSFPRSVSHAD